MRIFTHLILFAFACTSNSALAGDPSAAVDGFAKAPPEAQVRIVRIIFDDLFGSPDELRAHFIASCNALSALKIGNGEGKPDAQKNARLSTGKELGAKQTATLRVLCTAPIRKGVLEALNWKPSQETKQANESISVAPSNTSTQRK